MLTPDKIKEKSFQTTGRGSYRSEDVDSFMNEVSASYEQMFKENGDLIKKISILAKKVEEYRADEESLKMALLNAQKLADKITAEAKENAEKVVADAKTEAEKIIADVKAETDETIEKSKTEAEKILADANRQSNEILGNINRKVTHESLVYDMIQKEATEFKAKLVAMYKEHINLINQLPEIVDEKLDSAESEKPAEPEVTENVAAETAEEQVEEIVVEEATEETETVVEAETVPEVADTVTEEIEKNTIEEIEIIEEPAEKTPTEKKAFKLDLSKIDFADDIENEEADEAVPSVFEEVTEAENDEDDEETPPSISFKNFFKKK